MSSEKPPETSKEIEHLGSRTDEASTGPSVAFQQPTRTETRKKDEAPQLQTKPEATKTVDNKGIDITEHLLSLEDVCKNYSTHIDIRKPSNSRGLSDSQVTEKLSEFGSNVLTPPPKKHWFFQYLECLLKLFNLFLIFAGILVYILYGIDPENNEENTYLGAILIGVALLNAFIEFYQLQKSQAIMESFLNLIPQRCNVIRNNNLSQISASDLVPGDVVFVKLGDKVPADVLVFSSSELKVDNSSLTGESEAQERTNHKTHDNPLETGNLIFNGTLAVAGEAYGIVIRTGDRTVLGQIAGMTSNEDKRESPLSKEINDFVKIIAVIASSTAIIFFAVGMGIYRDINFTLSFAISVLVAWVPQGLPATVTMLLVIAAKRMASQNVLVKDLQGVETLGAITLLATDKTGTLTKNRMTVTNIWTSLKMYTTSTTPSSDEPIKDDTPGLKEILHNCSLCSRAKFDRTDIPVDKRTIIGDATESGLTRFTANQLSNFDTMKDEYPKVFEIPFNSDNKWALSIHNKLHPYGCLTLYIKGAPERILRLCSSILIDGETIPLTEEHKTAFEKAYKSMASQGHRVIAFAQFLLPEKDYPADYTFSKEQQNYPKDNFTFVGLVSLEDPPKHGVREAIGRCRTAGIQVIMVTGDHPLTAEAIGRKINLIVSETKEQLARRTERDVSAIQENEYTAIVIHGEQIDSFTDDDWDIIFSKNEIIFARTSPKHKLEIVKRAQAMGHIVGVTGDGVNDSPALKKADLGIAMNKSGSDVSKEAAAMVLLDDNFASTVRGIEEGRLIFTNLKKSIRYTLTHIMPEVLPILLYVLVPIPLPLSAIQILVIDLGFELLLALSFAWDPTETKRGLMKLPPRKPVTEESFQRIRKKRQREQESATFDEETGERQKPSMSSRVTRIFSKTYWSEVFEKPIGEVLVDSPLLIWAYLEAGIIETIACLTAYFVFLYVNWGITPSNARSLQLDGSFRDDAPDFTTSTGRTLTASEQQEALAQVQSLYYLSIMILQAFNLFVCKCRIRLPFGRYMFKNRRTFYSLAAGVALSILIVYVPPFNVAFGTAYTLNPLYLFIPLGFGVFLLAYATARTVFLRKFFPIQWNPEIQGLQMFPTIFSLAATRTSTRQK